MTVSKAVRARVRAQAGDRCGYCRSAQQYLPAPLEIEHIMPLARGGQDAESNLWLACDRCNRYKGTQTYAVDPLSGRRVRLFNPRSQQWKRHFAWSEDSTRILGKTAVGRATVIALRLNNPYSVAVRKQWAAVGWHPPQN